MKERKNEWLEQLVMNEIAEWEEESEGSHTEKKIYRGGRKREKRR